MNLRINLLNDSEYRYQGAVSHKFIVQIVLMVGVAVSFIVVALALFHVRSIRSDLDWNREQWNDLRPKFKHVQAMQEDLDVNGALLDSLKSHLPSRLEWQKLLQEFRALVPPSVQLGRLQIVAIDEKITKEAPRHIPTALPQQVNARRYKLTIQGSAVGDSSNETVLNFLTTFSTSESFADLLDDIKLQSLQRETQTGSKFVRFNFTLVASTIPMELVWTGTD